MHAAVFILYVADQGRARDFYRHVLAAEPVLDVPGMTKFDLGGATLGLMPAADMQALLPGQIRAGGSQRCELYLRRADAEAARARGAEAHVLSALAMGIYPAESFGRIHHLPQARLGEVMGGLRDCGLIDASGRFTDAGRATKTRIESLTDARAEAPYDGLEPLEFEQLIVLLEPISRRLEATGSQ